MPDLRRSNAVLYVLAGVLVVVAGGRWVRAAGHPSGPVGTPPAARADAGVRVDRQAGGEAVVHVAGEVRHPGVYHLGAGTRVEEAVRRAGGPTRHADLDAINLAAKAEDGRQIIVPARGPAPTPGGTDAATADPTQPPAAPVNLNTA